MTDRTGVWLVRWLPMLRGWGRSESRQPLRWRLQYLTLLWYVLSACLLRVMEHAIGLSSRGARHEDVP